MSRQDANPASFIYVLGSRSCLAGFICVSELKEANWKAPSPFSMTLVLGQSQRQGGLFLLKSARQSIFAPVHSPVVVAISACLLKA